MSVESPKLPLIDDETAAGPHTRQELEQWATRYRESAGAATVRCATLLDSMFELKLLDATAIDPMVELLEILETLSADPITISCAMVYVAGQGGRDISRVVESLPPDVRLQLDELNKLKHFESDSSLGATERSAEGLRRLLLALVKDVRVVLVDLAWQLVMMRGPACGSPGARNHDDPCAVGEPPRYLAVEMGARGSGFPPPGPGAIPQDRRVGRGASSRA
jgi:hypothetical protein